MSRRLEARRLGLACALLTAGCPPAAAPPSTSGPVALRTSSSLPGFQPIWVNTGLHPIRQPIAVGSAVVGIVFDGDHLSLVGIDPATGGKRWQQRMTLGDLAPGVAIDVAVLGDDKVAYLRRFHGDVSLAQLVVADARTGADRAVSPPGQFTSLPYACDNRKDVCIIGHGSGAGREHQYRFEIAKDDYHADSDGMVLGARMLDEPGLIDLGDRPENTLAWMRDGKLQWRVELGAALPRGFSSDHGGTWRRFAGQHVVVGSVNGAPWIADEQPLSNLALSSATAGLADATGRLLWLDRGSTLQCRLGSRAHAVRCRSRGATVQRGASRSSEGQDVTVEGFEPATGRTTWTVPVGRAEGLFGAGLSAPIAGPTQIVVTGPSGPVVLDYATGSLAELTPGAVYWCSIPARYDLSAYSWENGVWGYRHAGGELAVSCDDQRRPSTALPGPEPTLAVGARAGDHVVVAGPRGYVGFKLR